MFHGLIGAGAPPGMAFDVVMEDIEALNRRAEGPLAETLDFTKISVSTLGRVSDRYTLLDAGAALGRGCGPLVVRRAADGPGTLRDLHGQRVAVPGLGTTAYLLLRMFAPSELQPVPMRFDEIMPAVAQGIVDAGLVIHESRFTYPSHKLVELADLGVCWEQETGLPLPLGVIVGRASLDASTRQRVSEALRTSVEDAWRAPEAPWSFVREHAQELDDDVCRRHIALYVNAFSASLGDEGRRAIDALLNRARAGGWL